MSGILLTVSPGQDTLAPAGEALADAAPVADPLAELLQRPVDPGLLASSKVIDPHPPPTHTLSLSLSLSLSLKHDTGQCKGPPLRRDNPTKSGGKKPKVL